jgi:hypothetical protein
VKNLAGLYSYVKGLIGRIELPHNTEELESLLDAEPKVDPKF